jgi:hypothetical protein
MQQRKKKGRTKGVLFFSSGISLNTNGANLDHSGFLKGVPVLF